MPKVEPSGVILHGVCDIQTERCTAKDGGGHHPRLGATRPDANQCVSGLSRKKMRRGEWTVEGARVRQRV